MPTPSTTEPAPRLRLAGEGDDLAGRPRPTPRPVAVGATPGRRRPPTPAAPARPVMRAVPAEMNDAVCPFCAGGRPSVRQERCPRCGLADTPATRQPTAQRLGPWFSHQSRNPAAPGMNFRTLTELVGAGKLTADSIVRGPTSGQMWTRASRVRGVARLLGRCWKCGHAVSKTAQRCESCEVSQLPPASADVWLDPDSDPTPRAARVPNAWLAETAAGDVTPVTGTVGDFEAPQARPWVLWKVLASVLLLGLVALAAAAAVAPDRAAAFAGEAGEWVRATWAEGLTLLRGDGT